LQNLALGPRTLGQAPISLSPPSKGERGIVRSGEASSSLKGKRRIIRETIIRELTLEDILSDPLTHLVMRRDGVSASEIRALAEEAAKRAA
tara:strand:+ start:322 stop:594 length:273 start_codon:yes stop_codon:yes gene_type:complete